MVKNLIAIAASLVSGVASMSVIGFVYYLSNLDSVFRTGPLSVDERRTMSLIWVFMLVAGVGVADLVSWVISKNWKVVVISTVIMIVLYRYLE